MSDPAFRNNPWSAEHWNLTRQGEYVKKYGVDLARTKAKQAGAVFGSGRPPAVLMPQPKHTIIVQRRYYTDPNASLPRGYAGDGPPDEFVADNA